MNDNIVKKWKKKTWINADILFEDEFYAKTPDLNKTFPPSIKATYTVIGQNSTRSTLEELLIDNKNEKTTEQDTGLDQDKSTKI
jgi:hypothetical protein